MDVTPFLEVTLRTGDEVKKELQEAVTEHCEAQMQENVVDKCREYSNTHEHCNQSLLAFPPQMEEKAARRDTTHREGLSSDCSAAHLPMDLSKKKVMVTSNRSVCYEKDTRLHYEIRAVEATESSSLPGRRGIQPPSAKKHCCSVCEKTFATPSHLATHMRTHTGTRPYECPECKTTFTQSNNLRRHLRVHTRERPYKCAECQCAFRDSSHLQRHRLLHTGEKPFKCDVCGSAFAQSNTLRDHKRLHTGERPFGCGSFRQTCILGLDGHLSWEIIHHEMQHADVLP